MLPKYFVYFGLIFSFIGTFSYLKDTLKGNTKPNKVTWFIWALAPMIAFLALIKQGVGIKSLFTFVVGFNPLLVFLASFLNKKAYWKISKLDIICLIFALLGIVLWQVTSIANLAILFSIFADGIAGAPTIIKAYQSPDTENAYVYLGSATSAVITLLTIDIWSFEQFAFPVHILTICLLLFVLIKFNLGNRYKLFKN